MFGSFNSKVRFRRDSLVREISERSAAATLRRLSANVEEMSVAELRGYVRARALPWVAVEASQIAVERDLSDAQRDSLIAAALEQTAYLVAREVKVQPVVAMPTPHIRLRIAA